MLSTANATQRERAAIGAFQRLPKTLTEGIKQRTKDAAVPLLIREAARLSRNRVLTRIIAGGRYSPYRGVPGVKFGYMKRVTSTGTPGRVLVRPLEFGSDGRRYRDYLQNRDGTQVSVLRRTSRQFMPDTNYRGNAINRAAEAINDEVVQLWVDQVEEAAVAALDGEV